ncbi:MAG: response regulator [Verrucomicrobia bacterium]|nr:response regulator [Verrucomicrobiota bacterium]
MTPTTAQPRLRILLADADPDFFAEVTLLLDEIAPRRFVPVWAQTYAFAVTAMRRQPYDLCLVSSHIGHRSGSELARHLRANYFKTPVIMLACSEEMSEVAEGHPSDCLDRHRLNAAMLRQAIRDVLFRSMGGAGLHADWSNQAVLEPGRVAA